MLRCNRGPCPGRSDGGIRGRQRRSRITVRALTSRLDGVAGEGIVSGRAARGLRGDAGGAEPVTVWRLEGVSLVTQT